MRQVTVTGDVVSIVGDSPGELSQPPAKPVMWSDNGGKSSHAHPHAHTQTCIKHLLKYMRYMLHMSIYPRLSSNHFYILYTVCFLCFPKERTQYIRLTTDTYSCTCPVSTALFNINQFTNFSNYYLIQFTPLIHIHVPLPQRTAK